MNAYRVLVLLAALAAPFGISALSATSSAAGEAAPDSRDGRFANRTIQGVWGFSGGLAVVVPPAVPEEVPIVGLGIIVFDGTGTCVVTTTVNQNGTKIGPVTSDACTYSVNADGTGSSTAQFSHPQVPPSASVDFVIVDQGREIRFVNTDSVVGSFTARRQ